MRHLVSSDTRHGDLELYLPRTPLMSGADTARIMGFSSTQALYKARQRGQLPINLFHIEGRRGWFAATSAVRDWLEGSLSLQDRLRRPGGLGE